MTRFSEKIHQTIVELRKRGYRIVPSGERGRHWVSAKTSRTDRYRPQLMGGNELAELLRAVERVHV
jgi:hypothetical protein